MFLNIHYIREKREFSYISMELIDYLPEKDEISSLLLHFIGEYDKMPYLYRYEWKAKI